MSNPKEKQPEGAMVLLAPMPNPFAGSANPSASLSSLWGYILPALNHIVRSPTNAIDKAPALDISYHMGIHTATYNYFATQSGAASTHFPHEAECGIGVDNDKNTVTRQASGADLYEHLDKYYMDLTRELLLGAPEDDTTLIQYVIPCFKRYSVGAHSVDRLLDYVNRHYVKRAVDEDRGWLTLSDILDRSIEEGETRERIAKKLKERRATLDHVVPLGTLALRRFRMEFIEPLMAAPKIKGKKRRPGAAPIEDKSHLPKSRLGRAVWGLLEVQEINPEERLDLATDLAATLCAVGVRYGHPLRKRLEKFLTAGAP